jgi:hypothetical protein
LLKDAFEVVHTLRACDQMLSIKDDGWYTGDALLGPKLLLLTHGIRKPLIVKNGLCLNAIQPNFACNLDQNGII